MSSNAKEPSVTVAVEHGVDGISRRLDSLGRVVLPAEMRHTLGMATGDHISFFLRDGAIEIRKSTPSCGICHSATDLTKVNDGYICAACLAAIGREQKCAICSNSDARLVDRGGVLICDSCLKVIGAA